MRRGRGRPTKTRVPEQEQPITIGIDFGTTNSSVAILEGSSESPVPKCINNTDNDQTFIPSVVYYKGNGSHDPWIVGVSAQNKRMRFTNESDTEQKRIFYELKRLMGRKFSAIQDIKQEFAYDIVEGDGDVIRIRIGEDGQEEEPERIASYILRELRRMAERHKGYEEGTITRVVIAVPTEFDDDQTEAIRKAAKYAGFEWIRLVFLVSQHK